MSSVPGSSSWRPRVLLSHSLSMDDDTPDSCPLTLPADGRYPIPLTFSRWSRLAFSCQVRLRSPASRSRRAARWSWSAAAPPGRNRREDARTGRWEECGRRRPAAVVAPSRTPATTRSRCGSTPARGPRPRSSFTDQDAGRSACAAPRSIWMPGGDQNRFMKAIDGTGLAEVIRERHQGRRRRSAAPARGPP